MKSAISIFFLFLVVSVQSPFGQLFKLPFLVEHFMKHRTDQSVSLATFLDDHYISHHHDADLPEDEQLPFKDINFYSFGYAVVPGALQSKVMVLARTETRLILPQIFTLQQHTGSVFHPPRM
jgi:hypothetical protein